MTTALIVGCGYLGRVAGQLLIREGYRVLGTTRSPARTSELEALGIEPIVADVLDPASLTALPTAEYVLHCVGFDRKAGLPMRAVYVDGLRHVLDALAGRVGRFVYASSTGVYGQSDGGWVDETSATEPVSAAGQVVKEAEKVVETFRRDRVLDAVTLRFSGLYGPGRILRRASLERGEVIPGDPDHWLNLIEIRDAAACVLAVLEHPAPVSTTYNASDDRPISRADFYRLVAHQLGLPEPRFESSQDESRGGGRDASNKRVSNARIKAQLGVRLMYPDVTTGIPAAL